ncbi:hypothetical protein BJ742DRAFT_834391 [Cladochytrium replicatum]|nr:hypothetical protein BJ742DRAFT_834391 [Cladochytrium replicatum]
MSRASPQLAPEIILQIFNHLETAAQISIAGQVNRLWLQVSNDESLWLRECLKAGIVVPIDPAKLTRHVALLSVAAQQSLVSEPNQFLDISSLPFDEEALWRLCRETLAAAGLAMPEDLIGSTIVSSPLAVIGGYDQAPIPQWPAEASPSHSSSPQDRNRRMGDSSHCWKLLNLPLYLRYVPDVDIAIPNDVPQLRLLYSSYATLYRGFWDVYPHMKHLSRRLEKWLSKHLPSSFESFLPYGMPWRSLTGACPVIRKNLSRPEGANMLLALPDGFETIRKGNTPENTSFFQVVDQSLQKRGIAGSVNSENSEEARHDLSELHGSQKQPSAAFGDASGSSSQILGGFHNRYSSVNVNVTHENMNQLEDSLSVEQSHFETVNSIAGVDLDFKSSSVASHSIRARKAHPNNPDSWETLHANLEDPDAPVDRMVASSQPLSHGCDVEDEWGTEHSISQYDPEAEYFDENLWTFAKLQFTPKTSSKGFKELLLFYHLFRDGQSLSTDSQFGLFGTVVCDEAVVSLKMQPSRHLRNQRVFDLELLNFAVCQHTGKSLSLVITFSKSHQSNLLSHVIHMDEVTTRYQDYGTFGQFIDKYITDVERGSYSVGSHQVSNRDLVDTYLEWFDVYSLGSKIERAINQRTAIIASGRVSGMADRTFALHHQHLINLRNLLARLPPQMGTPYCPSPTVPPNTLSMFPSFWNGSGIAHTLGVEVKPATLSFINVSESNKKLYRVRLRYNFFQEDGVMTAKEGNAAIVKAYSDLMTPEFAGTATSPLIDVQWLTNAVMSSGNSLIDTDTDFHVFPSTHEPLKMTLPATAAQAMGVKVVTLESSVTLDVTWELLAILINMIADVVVPTLTSVTQIQLLSENLSVRYMSGETLLLQNEGAGDRYPIFNGESLVTNLRFFQLNGGTLSGCLFLRVLLLCTRSTTRSVRLDTGQVCFRPRQLAVAHRTPVRSAYPEGCVSDNSALRRGVSTIGLIYAIRIFYFKKIRIFLVVFYGEYLF